MGEQNFGTIGEYLKAEREKKDLSISYIGQQTKISPRTLENIESNNIEKLPAKIYVQGFVKSYAKTLGLDEAECIALFKKTFEVPEEVKSAEPETESAPVKKVEKTKESHDSPIDNPKVQIAVFAVVVGILIVGMTIIFSGGEKEEEVKKVAGPKVKPVMPKSLNAKSPLQPTVKPQEKPAEPAKEKIEAPAIEINVDKNKEVVTEVAEPEKKKKPEVKKEEKKVAATEKPAEEKKEEKKEKEIRLRPFPGEIFTFNTNLTSTEIDELLPKKYQNSLRSDEQNVFVNAVKGDTWLTYKSDENPVKKFVLKKGRTVMIRGRIVQMFLGNVHVTQIFLNNKPLSIKSKSGVKSLIFPKELSKDYRLPLFIYNKDGSVTTSKEYMASTNNN